MITRLAEKEKVEYQENSKASRDTRYKHNFERLKVSIIRKSTKNDNKGWNIFVQSSGKSKIFLNFIEFFHLVFLLKTNFILDNIKCKDPELTNFDTSRVIIYNILNDLDNCCGCSRILAEPMYHSLVLGFYPGLVLHWVRLTNNLAEIICRLEVFKGL